MFKTYCDRLTNAISQFESEEGYSIFTGHTMKKNGIGLSSVTANTLGQCALFYNSNRAIPAYAGGPGVVAEAAVSGGSNAYGIIDNTKISSEHLEAKRIYLLTDDAFENEFPIETNKASS